MKKSSLAQHVLTCEPMTRLFRTAEMKILLNKTGFTLLDRRRHKEIRAACKVQDH